MTNDEYLTTQNEILLLASLVRKMKLRDFLAAVDRCETVAPLTDPTLYRMGMDKLSLVKRAARGALAFQQAIPPLEEWQRVESEAAAAAYAAGGHIESGLVFVRDDDYGA